MALLTLLDAQLAFGHVPLLDHTSFSLDPQERVGLIGRNGSGKSSLLRTLAKLETLDDGAITVQQHVRIAYVAQDPALDGERTVTDEVAKGLEHIQQLHAQYASGDHNLDLDALQTQIEALDGWNWESRVTETLQRLHLNPDAPIRSLSGGLRKRVALAQALVARPDILLLDEPTNHLDLDSIRWLETLLNEYPGSAVVISHDRAFLDAVCTRMVDLDRGRLLSYPGNYAQYQTQKAEQLAQEAAIQARADKLLAQEEIWIRKGVEARRTRAQGRINRLQKLRADRAARKAQIGRVKLDIDRGELGGKLVAELTDVCKGFDLPDGQRRKIVDKFSTTIMRGDKIGLIGPNGAGKTTLLQLILGKIQPDSGGVRQGVNLSIAYFDQMRDQLNLDATLEDFISPGSEWIEIGTKRTHVRSYLADFLFSPARATAPVRTLSGGERNRLMLARLFARPANVLVLDEPTNDLDIDTLELLEELLADYDGTVFLVSHDRQFVDNVVTSIIAHEGNGQWREYEGGIQDWLTQAERSAAWASTQGNAQAPITVMTKTESAPSIQTTASSRKKLSYKEQRELDNLPSMVESLEQEQKAIDVALADSSLFVSDPHKAAALAQRHAEIDDELITALERWELLSAKV